MAGGRALNWRIAAADRTAIADVARIGKRGRLVVPRELASDLPWCNSGTALVALPEPGRARIACWEPEGPRIEARRGELQEQAVRGDQAALDALLNMENSFVRLGFEKGRRLTLPVLVLAHLGAEAGDEIFCVRRAGDLELWTPSYRAKRLLPSVA